MDCSMQYQPFPSVKGVCTRKQRTCPFFDDTDMRLHKDCNDNFLLICLSHPGLSWPTNWRGVSGHFVLGSVCAQLCSHLGPSHVKPSSSSNAGSLILGLRLCPLQAESGSPTNVPFAWMSSASCVELHRSQESEHYINKWPQWSIFRMWTWSLSLILAPQPSGIGFSFLDGRVEVNSIPVLDNNEGP